jgi:hypothetical protein
MRLCRALCTWWSAPWLKAERKSGSGAHAGGKGWRLKAKKALRLVTWFIVG